MWKLPQITILLTNSKVAGTFIFIKFFLISLRRVHVMCYVIFLGKKFSPFDQNRLDRVIFNVNLYLFETDMYRLAGKQVERLELRRIEL